FKPEEILKKYPRLEIDPELLYKVRNGQILDMKIKDYILFTSNNQAIALYKPYHKDDKKIKPAVMFY
ncbi:MAG: hypothetical protein PHF21_02570, partial [Bacilli bacterium]|nr:hypothetical protein [Bacilli bacterium]